MGVSLYLYNVCVSIPLLCVYLHTSMICVSLYLYNVCVSIPSVCMCVCVYVCMYVEEYLAKSRGHTPSQRSNACPDTGKHQTTKATVAPAVQDMLTAAFQNAKGSPPKRPSLYNMCVSIPL